MKSPTEKFQQDQADLFELKYDIPFKDSGKCFKAVFDKLGLHYEFKPLTEVQRKNGKPPNPDFSKDAIAKYDIPEDLRNIILRYRKGQNLKNYYKAFSEQDGDFVHPEYNTVRTGRFSSSNPNIQGVTRQSFKGSPRDCIIPIQDDHILLAVDYSQAEYRMFADYIGNKKLISDLNDGADYHQLASDFAGVERSQAKNVNFALIYGSGDKLLSQMIGSSLTEAQSFKAKILRYLGPEAIRFIQECKNKSVITRWTGERVFPDKSNKNINYLIQGGIADVCRKALYDLFVEFYDDPRITPYIQIHDEIVFSVCKSLLGTKEFMDICVRIKEVMEGVYPSRNGIILKVDFSKNNLDTRASFDKSNLIGFEV